MASELDQKTAPGYEQEAILNQEVVLRGRLTVCDHPAAGLRIVATEVVKIGVESEILHKPCLTRTRLNPVGSVSTDQDGRFTLRFRRTERPDFACSFSDRVRLQAFDGNLRVWRSADRTITQNMTFNAEIAPGCAADRTLIRVLDDNGIRVGGAEVFVNGLKKGTTAANGELILQDIHAGDTLAARLLLHENPTSRPKHKADSQQNWNYRVYITSVPVLHDLNGDNVQVPLKPVSSPFGVQELRVSRNNTLVGCNLTVSVEWSATQTEMMTIRDRLSEASELLYNATDGQFLIERLSLTENRRDWDAVDIRVMANRSQGSNATVDGFAGSSGRVTMNPYDSLFLSAVFVHELGHYIFGMGDEYKEGEGWDPANGTVRCTLAGSGNTAPFGQGFDKEACMMNGDPHFQNLNKFCSGHPANPHIPGTQQGRLSCWTNVVERFSKAPDWRILSPDSRGAIVGRLPESGIELGTATTPPAGVVPVLSCIPVRTWKPRRHIRLIPHPDERPGLVARTIFQGSPVDDVHITLKDIDDRTIYQGTTKKLTFLDGTAVQEGEILVHGAHVDESLHAYKKISAGVYLVGSVKIKASDPDKIEIPLVVVQFPLMAQQFLQTPGSLAFALTAGGAAAELLPAVSMRLESGETHHFAAWPSVENGSLTGAMFDVQRDESIEFLATLPDVQQQPHLIRTTATVHLAAIGREIHVFSYDGRFELRIPEGGLLAPVQLVVEEIEPGAVPELAESDRLLAGPYRVSSTQGDRLQKPGMLYLSRGEERLSLEPGRDGSALELLEHDAREDTWRPIPFTWDETSLLVTARLERLATYALVQRNS